MYHAIEASLAKERNSLADLIHHFGTAGRGQFTSSRLQA